MLALKITLIRIEPPLNTDAHAAFSHPIGLAAYHKREALRAPVAAVRATSRRRDAGEPHHTVAG
ncbi:hypothetical protein [Burkholderia perseverans]|uniref:hypothetical protein n=1 Tax=Burkholderia perseverans TaxID=2615214 RepID=UPI001FEE6140|nr:hypothetical protein [Burkholderia perseverans]